MSQLAPLLLPFEQIARAYAEYVTQRIERGHVEPRGVAVRCHQARRRRDVHLATAGLHERVGGAHTTLAHQLGQSESHVEHATNVTPEADRRQSIVTLAQPSKRDYNHLSEQGPK